MSSTPFRRMAGSQMNPQVGNCTGGITASIGQLPPNILEAFIPGYGFISQFLYQVLGFDITLVVSICFILVALASSLRYLWKHAERLFKQYWMASVR
jgi:mitochondrial chaperone BCS1